MNQFDRSKPASLVRKPLLVLTAAVFLVGAAGLLSSQQLKMTATYPIPAGVYNQIVTTGNSGTTPANTTLNRNAGNTILVPQPSNAGSVGIGTPSPASYAKLDVNTSSGKAIHTMDSANGGLLIGYQGPTIQARTTADGNTANLVLQGGGGQVGIGMSPASALSVNGSIQPGDDISACGASNAGSLRWHSGALQACAAGAWTAVGGGATPNVYETGPAVVGYCGVSTSPPTLCGSRPGSAFVTASGVVCMNLNASWWYCQCPLGSAGFAPMSCVGCPSGAYLWQCL